ncbi:MAG: M4 family metallopeptidase [Legionella sp.]|nr:M4 family metallopeptidase [Legionella sp.]
MNKNLVFALAGALLSQTASTATRIDLKHQSGNYLKPYVLSNSTYLMPSTQLHQIREDVDFNQTRHIRLQQMYAGVPVWNATAIVHLPKATNKLGLYANLNRHTSMSGVIYEGLEQDLGSHQAKTGAQALENAKHVFEEKLGRPGVGYTQESIKTIVYIDKSQQAHYAFLVSFYYDDGETGAHRPTSIMNAASLEIYRQWDGVLSESPMELSEVLVGGVGGNEKIGEVFYDGAEGHLPAVKAQSMAYEGKQGCTTFQQNYCMLFNNEVMIYDMSYGGVNPSLCSVAGQFGSLFWLSHDYNGTRWKGDEVNGGYSPSLDAFYGANTVINFYREWYGMPALVQEDGKTPMPLNMRVHYGRNFDNAFWDGQQMTFGDGGSWFYPLTSLGVAAHEISHGFTSQHSDIDYSEPEMGALHEAFSDEAAVAIQYYATGKSVWDIGRDIKKNEGAMRYLDNPKKDGVSIDHMRDFDASEVHAGAGIFNKAFYLIATSKGWDIRKAFDVMLKANIHYWNSSMTTLTEAACGVTAATQDYGYNVADVRVAFAQVCLDTGLCFG